MAFVEASVVFLVLSLTVLPVATFFAIKGIDRRREQY
jgi:hypothetical protein